MAVDIDIDIYPKVLYQKRINLKIPRLNLHEHDVSSLSTNASEMRKIHPMLFCLLYTSEKSAVKHAVLETGPL